MAKIFSIIIILFPILSIYMSPIPGVDLGSFVYLIFLPFAIIKNNEHFYLKKNVSTFILFVFYIMIITFVGPIFQQYVDIDIIVLRLLKFIFIICSGLLLCTLGYFDLVYAKKALIFVAILSSLFVIIQQIMYTSFGVRIPGFYMPLVMNEQIRFYWDLDELAQVLYRPGGFFLEPSHYTQYIVLPFLMILFSDYVKYKYIKIAIIMIGVFCSTSGMGMVLLTTIIIIYFLFTNKNKLQCGLLLIILLSLLYYMFSVQDSNFIVKAIERINGENQFGGVALQMRSSSFNLLLNLDAIQIIFGVGFGNIPLYVYYNGWSYILWCFGIVGVCLFLNFLVFLFRRGNLYQKIYIFIYIVLLSVAQLFTTNMLIFILPFLTKIPDNRLGD